MFYNRCNTICIYFKSFLNPLFLPDIYHPPLRLIPYSNSYNILSLKNSYSFHNFRKVNYTDINDFMIFFDWKLNLSPLRKYMCTNIYVY